MRRHHEKKREMARSILPSKNRVPARKALASTKRANRRAISQGLRDITPSSSAQAGDFDEWDDRHDLRRYPYIEIRRTVWLRQGGDKLNPFIRWAIATTSDLPIEDRLPRLQADLPRGLVGDHAISHLEREPELRPLQEQDWRYWRVSQADREAARAIQTARDLELLRTLLHDVISDGGLETLNRTLKHCDNHTTHQACVEASCVRRCLAGLHDIDTFLLDISAMVKGHRVVAPTSESLPVRRFRTFLEQLRSAADLERQGETITRSSPALRR